MFIIIIIFYFVGANHGTLLLRAFVILSWIVIPKNVTLRHSLIRCHSNIDQNKTLLLWSHLFCSCAKDGQFFLIGCIGQAELQANGLNLQSLRLAKTRSRLSGRYASLVRLIAHHASTSYERENASWQSVMIKTTYVFLDCNFVYGNGMCYPSSKIFLFNLCL